MPTSLLSTWPCASCQLCQALADVFRVNKSVKKVNLSYNNFGDEGLKARALQRGPRLGGLWQEWDLEVCGRGVV